MDSIHSLFKGFKLNAILTAVIELILGIYLLTNPAAGEATLSILVALGVLLYGVVNIISYFRDHNGYWDTARLLLGVCAAIAAIVLFANPNALVNFVVIVLGIFMIISACNEIRRGMTLKACGFPQWWGATLVGVIFIILGASLVLNSRIYGELIFQCVGVFLIIEAITDLLTILKISKTAKEVRDNIVIRY